MKCVLWATVAAAPCFLGAPASAGDYHKDGTLVCSQCHVMHYSQSHGYKPNGFGPYVSLIGAAPHEYLLRGPVNELCLSCHDAEGVAPDVYGSANGGNGPTDVRLAGYLNRQGDAAVATGHTLESTAIAPGSAGGGWSNPDGLDCIDCHDPHGGAGSGTVTGDAGYSLYRNLRTGVGQAASHSTWITYNYDSHGSNNLTRDVFERQRNEYDESDVDWNEPNSADSAIARFCGGCHGDFHGAVGGAGIGGVPSGAGFVEFVRHPSAGVDIGAVGGGHSSLSLFNQHPNKV